MSQLEEPEVTQEEFKKVEPVAPPPALKSSIKFTAPVSKKDEEVRDEDVYKRQVFYQKSPVYNPQFTYGKPYTRVHSRSGTSSNYGKFERQGSESNDGRRYPGNVLFVPTVSEIGRAHV